MPIHYFLFSTVLLKSLPIFRLYQIIKKKERVYSPILSTTCSYGKISLTKVERLGSV